MNTDHSAMEPEPSKASHKAYNENLMVRLLRILQHKSDTTRKFLDYVLIEAIDITDSKSGYIYRYHEDRKEFVLNTWSKAVMKEVPETDEPVESCICNEAVRQRKPIIVNDFASEIPPKKHDPKTHLQLTKCMTVPVFSDDKIVGVVGVANKTDDYTQADVLQLQLLMDAVWKVVEQRETLKREQHLKNVLLGIRNVNQLITKENDPKKLIDEACNNLTETMGYFNAWIALIDKNGMVTDTASSGFDDDFEILKKHLEKGKLPQCAEKSLKSNGIVVMDQPAINCTECPVSSQYKNRSGLCCPMGYNEKIYGVLSVSAPEEYAHIQKEHELFAEVAGDLGFALNKIENENERKLIEEKLFKSEAKFRLITENTADCITLMDMELNITYVSPSIYNIRGYTVEEAMQHKMEDIFTPTSLLKVQQLYQEVMEKLENNDQEVDSIVSLELEQTHKDGSTIWVDVSLSLIFNHQLNPAGIVSVAREITEKKQSEEKLKTSDKIFRHSMDMLCIAGFDGYFKTLNPAWSKILGYKDEELLSKPWLEFVHPDDVEATKNVGAVIVDGNEVYQFENRYICKDGTVKWLSWNSFPYPEEEIMFGVARDVTERKKTEQEFNEYKNKLQSIIQVAPTGIGLLTNRIFREVNPQMCKMTGYEPQDLIGKDARMLYPTQEDYDFVGKVKYDKIKNTGSGTVETRWKRKDGDIIHILLASTPLDQADWEKGITFTATDITAIKKAETELRFKEHRFRSLVQNSKDIISMYAADGTILYNSPGTKPILGYEPEELIGNNVLEIAHPNDKEKALEMLAALSKMNSGESARFDIRAMHKNGSVVWLDATLTNMLDEPGIRAIIGNYRNITERRRTTLMHKIQYNIAHAVVTAKNLNQLYEVVRNELQELINVNNFVIALYNEETGMFTSPFEKDEKTKTPPSWSAENSLSGLVIKKKHSLLLRKQDIIQLAEKGEIQLRGERAACWLGVPLLLNKKPVGLIITQSYDNPNAFDQSGIEILEIIANQLSIYIENKKAEENTQKLSKAIVQSPASIVITDPHGTIEYVNPKFTELTGFTLEEAIGQNPRLLKSGEHDDAFYKNLWDTITAGKDWSGEIRNMKKNGETYWESASISPLVNESGEITHFVAVKEDITEKKKMIEDLIEAKEQAEASDKLKTSFMNNISHEIRTPLNGIIGFGQLISQSGLTFSERESYLQILQKSTNRLINTVNDYMDASLIASGNLKVSISEFPVNLLLDEMYSRFKPECDEKHLELHLQIPDKGKDHQLNTDRELINKVLLHLIGNAVKFTTTGKITFGYKVGTSVLEFFVKDTGIGISSEKMETIFKAFAQEETGSTRAYEGSGLGLTITKGIIDKLGGKIWLNSEKGKGTEFYFTMQRASSVTRSETETPITTGDQVGEEKHLALIAEDDDSNYFYLDVLLRKASFKTLRAVNGKEAVELFRQHPDISFILMDIKMPIMDGLEATAIIKSEKPDLPIIAITAYALTGDEQRIKQAGCDDYIAKPLTRETLIKKLQTAGIKIS